MLPVAYLQYTQWPKRVSIFAASATELFGLKWLFARQSVRVQHPTICIIGRLAVRVASAMGTARAAGRLGTVAGRAAAGGRRDDGE